MTHCRVWDPQVLLDPVQERRGGPPMSDHFRLTEARIAPFFPKSRGRPRAEDRRVLSGIIRVLQRGLHGGARPQGAGP